MQRWPAVDRAVRRRLLRELRRRQNLEASARSPAERLARLEDLLSLARTVRSQGATVASASDESPDLLVRMMARFRQADERG